MVITPMDTENRDELISTALDGEPVDVEALRAALATAEGRASLAAFVLLRAATAADQVAPGRRFDEAVLPRPRRRPAWLPAPPRVPFAWAASIAIVATAASFWFGTSLRAPATAVLLTAPPIAVTPVASIPAPGLENPTAGGRRPTETSPTSPRRVVRVVDQPPTPTRVLRFVPGVDWISAPE